MACLLWLRGQALGWGLWTNLIFNSNLRLYNIAPQKLRYLEFVFLPHLDKSILKQPFCYVSWTRFNHMWLRSNERLRDKPLGILRHHLFITLLIFCCVMMPITGKSDNKINLFPIKQWKIVLHSKTWSALYVLSHLSLKRK